MLKNISNKAIILGGGIATITGAWGSKRLLDSYGADTDKIAGETLSGVMIHHNLTPLGKGQGANSSNTT